MPKHDNTKSRIWVIRNYLLCMCFLICCTVFFFFLEQNADYVLTLAAVNDMGVSPLVYKMVTIKEQNIMNTLETSNPLLPPVGVKTNVISSNAIEVLWTDNSLLDLDVIIAYNFFSDKLTN